MSHYTVLQEQIKADIIQAWATSSVCFGAPRQANVLYPLAVVNIAVERANVGRQVHQEWTAVVEGRFDLNDVPEGTDFETFLMGKGVDLAQVLAPYDEDSVPEPASFYADIGTQRRVVAIIPIDTEPTDAYVAVQLSFACMTVVYQ